MDGHGGIRIAPLLADILALARGEIGEKGVEIGVVAILPSTLQPSPRLRPPHRHRDAPASAAP